MIAAPPPPPARVQVVAQEFRFTLSRQSIKAGWAIVELRNGGQDAHDLRMRRVGGTRVYAPKQKPTAATWFLSNRRRRSPGRRFGGHGCEPGS